MLKRSGFTIIEILTTITILGIVATISVPEFWRWRDRDQYRAEGQALFDTMLDARNSALTNEFCSDGNASVRWSVLLSTNTDPMFYRLRCYTDDTTFINESERVNMIHSDLETIDFNGAAAPAVLDGGTGATFPVNVLSSFFSGGVNGRIDYTKSGSNRVESYAMVIGHDDSDFQHTICFNRVAGFPTFNKVGSTCPEY